MSIDFGFFPISTLQAGARNSFLLQVTEWFGGLVQITAASETSKPLRPDQAAFGSTASVATPVPPVVFSPLKSWSRGPAFGPDGATSAVAVTFADRQSCQVLVLLLIWVLLF